MKLVFGLMLLAVVSWAESSWNHWAVRDQETITRTFTLSGPPMRLIVDNVDGYVHVKGVEGSQVRVSAHKIIRADTDDDMRKGKSEVKLNMAEEPGTVSIDYDAPWRCKGEHRNCNGEKGRRFYNVTYDINVEAPRNARLVVSSVNNGNIEIENTNGNFDISNVNGGIKMADVSGSGSVHTVNGPVSVSFARNPSEASSFKSVNGPIEAFFQPGLSADLSFQTLNGQVYADFDVTLKANAGAQAEQRDGKFIYRSHGVRNAVVGQGGPALSFDTVNGSITLRQLKQGS